MTINQEEMCRVLLAYSSTWQDLLGAASPDEALLKTKAYQAEDAGDEPVTYPRAIIEAIEKERKTGSFGGRGALLISFEIEPPDDQCDSVETQRKWVVDTLNAIDDEIRTISYSRATPTGYDTSHLYLRSTAWSVEPFRVPDSEREDIDPESQTPPKPLWAHQLRIEY
jgi:hypothetical protein